MNKLFNDRIGLVIKKLAVGIFIAELCIGFVSGIVYTIEEAETFFAGFFAILLFTMGGFVVGYLSSIFIYAFGVIVDKIVKIEQKMDRDDVENANPNTSPKTAATVTKTTPIANAIPKTKTEDLSTESLKNKKIMELNSLFIKGLITREEYTEAAQSLKNER